LPLLKFGNTARQECVSAALFELLQRRMDVGQFLVQPGDLCLEFGDKVVLPF